MVAVIFDIDGTLASTTHVDDVCFKASFKDTFETAIENEKWSSFKNVTDWGITEEILLREKNRYPTRREYEHTITGFINHLKGERIQDPSQFKEVEGAFDFIKYIESHTNWKIGIATGSWEKSGELKLKSIGIDPYKYAYSNCSYYKSREGIVRHSIRQIIELSNERIETIIYFGDGVWDYKTCQNLGINFIGIDVSNNGKLKKMGAKTIFRNYLERDKIIDTIKKIESKLQSL